MFSSEMAIVLPTCFLHFVFLFRESSCGLAALWSDASLEAGPLSALTKPQMELYFSFKTQLSQLLLTILN